MFFRILSSSLLVLTLSACANNLKPADTSKLVNSEFNLFDTKVSLFLPPEASITTPPNSDITFIDFKPDSREQFKISLYKPTSLENSDSRTNSRSFQLANDATLTYNLLSYTEQGSGGPEASLLGNISFEDATTIEVTCHIQQDVNKPNARWCISYLHHLKILSKN